MEVHEKALSWKNQELGLSNNFVYLLMILGGENEIGEYIPALFL
jgi:hypothetical protein